MRRGLGLCLFPLLLSLFAAQKTPRAQQKTLVLTHVTVIDATGAAAKPDVTLIVTGDRISEMGRGGEVHIPQDAQIVLSPTV